MKLAFRVARISAAAIPVLVVVLVAGTSVAWPAATVRASAASCDSLKTLSLANTVIDSASVVPASTIGAAPGAPAAQVPATCRVHATVSHPGANDRIGIDVWMPVEGWNGRFQGVGGGGYAGGNPNSMAGPAKTRDFARLFLAPGVGHCAGGAGPQPDKPFNALVDWVEHGRAPATLNGVLRDATGAVTATRPICLYPQTAAYKGSGPTTAASSFVCRSSSKKKK